MSNAGINIREIPFFLCARGNNPELIYEQIKANVGNVPFIMEFTFGEYGYVDDGRNTTGGLMLSFTAFTK